MYEQDESHGKFQTQDFPAHKTKEHIKLPSHKTHQFYTFSLQTCVFLLIGMSFWIVKMLAIFYQFFQFWDIKNFFSQALHIDESELESVTWRDVQSRLVSAQKDHLMCIHKEQLTDLDIYHRILRFKNYLVAMVNKDILPMRISPLPCLPSFVFFSHSLKFNLEWLFFKVRK